MRMVELKCQHVISIITHYYSNIIKSSHDNTKMKSFPESGVYKLPHVLLVRLFVEHGAMTDPIFMCDYMY